ncbi:MAG: pyridoxal-dependent decarboxylase, exosortase A system-associated [Desulfosoma sp.]
MKQENVSSTVESILNYFDVRDGRILIGGRPLESWATEYGTPLYVYDFQVVRKKISRFRSAFPSDVKLFYAVKANPNPALLKAMVPMVDGFDVASCGELKAVIQAGANPGEISFAGPGKRRDELLHAVELGIGSINVESLRELEILAELSSHDRPRPRVSIRVNPDFELHGSGMKMGGGPKPFGIDAELIPKVLEKIKGLPLDFQGFHIYAGSQNLQPHVLAETIERSLALLARFSQHAPEMVKWLNLGGGFGIPYYDGDRELDLELLGNRVSEIIKAYRHRFPAAQFIFELGRYLVGESGIYLVRVLYRKVSRGKTFLVVDGGMNHHLAASGNFGQILRKNFPIVTPKAADLQQREKVDVVGPLCTPLDVLGSNISLPPLYEGDLIGILCSGAYGYTASPLQFLSHPLPAEVVIEN